MVFGGFPVFAVRGDPTRRDFDERVEGFGERGSALDVMVANKLKDLVLREDRSLVIEGAITKMKGKSRCDPISAGDLDKIADREGISF